MENKKFWAGILCAVVCEMFFGFSFIFTKSITNIVSPIELISWRFLLAFVVMSLCIIFRIIKVDFKKAPLKPLLLVALFQPVLYFIGETWGISLTTASESGIMMAWIPVAALIFAAVFLKERPRKTQIAGIGIALCGVTFMVIMQGTEASFNPIGYLMLLMAVVSYGLYSICSQKAVQFSDIEKTYIMISSGAAVFTAIALVQGLAQGTAAELIKLPFTNKDFLIAILYLGIGSSVIAFFLYNKAISLIGTSRTASFVGLSTVVTIVSGVVILKESLSAYQIIGAVLILGGVYLANIEIKSRKLKTENQA